MSRNPVLYKTLVVGIILLFIGLGINPSTGIIIEKKSFISIGSPSYIQDLIDNASDGDTIYIPSGTYYENIVIDKSISLIGEDKYSTIIDGGENGDVVTIETNWINISGFTIQNSGTLDPWHSGIKINDTSFCKITNNILTNNAEGIHLGGNAYPYEYCDYNTIANNIIMNNRHEWYWSGTGINLCHSSRTIVTENLIDNNQNGIVLIDSYRNTISKNNITLNSEVGLTVAEYATMNIIKENNFIKNERSATFLWVFIPPLTRWSRNYWDNHTGIGPKLISGFMLFPPIPLIPLINFDWRPAKEPYDI